MIAQDQNLSLSPEHNTSRTIKHINECIDYDNGIKEFYTALGNSEDIQYFRTSNDDNIASLNIFTLFSSSPFPSIVKTHYQFSEQIATCGCLPEIQRYYYIIDNKLFLWRTNTKSYSDGCVEQLMEEEKVITAVSTIERGRDRFFTKSVNNLLAVATPTYIRVYPLENDELNPTVFYTFKTNFGPTCLCAGGWGQLFIGATDSQLYSLQFKVQTGWFSSQQLLEDYAITKLTSFDITNAVTSFISMSASPIIKICFDPTTSLLATIDITQTFRIYSYEKEKLSIQYTYTPPKGTKFVAISPVYLSDSVKLRFIVFTQKGERFYFGQYQTRFLKFNKIGLRCQRKPPNELTNEIVIDAFQQCGYTAFICKESIVGLQVIHSDKDTCYELTAKAKLNGYGISIAGMPHPFCWLETNSFHAPIVNQHFMDSMEFFVLTSSGGSTIKFRPPCYFVHQQFISEKYQYNESTNEMMDRYSPNDESCAMCLLLASIHPEESDNLLYISGEFDRLQTLHFKILDEENEDGENPKPPVDFDYLSPDKLTPMTHAFFIRVQRLINFMWEAKVFCVSEDNIIKISQQFSAVSPDILKRLNHIIELSQKYILYGERSSPSFDEHRLVLYQIEREQLESLQVFLEELIETLKFIRILRKQKAALLTMAIANVSPQAISRLENDPFLPTFQTPTYVISALREYAISLITTFKEMIDTQSKDTLAKFSQEDPYSFSMLPDQDEVPLIRLDLTTPSIQTDFQAASQQASAEPWLRMEANLHLLTAEISTECPSFLNSPEALVIKAELDIQAASKETNQSEKKRLAHNACKTFLTNIGYDYDVCRICSAFISLGFDIYAVRIAAARAKFVDDAQLGYYWYINGCDKEELNSKKKFEDVSRIYESVFDAAYSNDGLNEILETGDELFILLVYQHLLNTDEIERLLNLDNKLVLDFLKENAPRLVWKYYIAHKKYKEAILDLIKYASDASVASTGFESDEISFDQRIKYLQTASNYARSENFDELAHEAQIRIECAKIQKEMSPEKVGEPLKDLTILFKEAERKYLWSYLLKLASLMRIDNFFRREIDMKTLWINFLLRGDGSNVYTNEKPTESETNRKLKILFDEIGIDKDALNPDYLVPSFEDFSNYRGFRPEWAVETLTNLKIDGSRLFNSYVALINRDDLPVERINQLIYAALWLLGNGFSGNISLIDDKIKNVLENPESPFYNEIHEFMK